MTSQNGDFTMMASVGTASCTALLADLCFLKSLPHVLVHLFCLLRERVTHLSTGPSLCSYFSRAISTHCNVRARIANVTPTTASQGPPTLSSIPATSNGDSTGGWGWEENQGGSRQSTELKPFILPRCGLPPITNIYSSRAWQNL